MGYLNPGSSYLCSNDPRVHFGLGPVDRVDALEVVWPDGSEELFAGTAATDWWSFPKEKERRQIRPGQLSLRKRQRNDRSRESRQPGVEPTREHPGVSAR